MKLSTEITIIPSEHNSSNIHTQALSNIPMPSIHHHRWQHLIHKLDYNKLPLPCSLRQINHQAEPTFSRLNNTMVNQPTNIHLHLAIKPPNSHPKYNGTDPSSSSSVYNHYYNTTSPRAITSAIKNTSFIHKSAIQRFLPDSTLSLLDYKFLNITTKSSYL